VPDIFMARPTNESQLARRLAYHSNRKTATKADFATATRILSNMASVTHGAD
jgi:hypothetical protein